MANENTAPAIDETPLSPVERQESLEKHLQMRPDAQDLKNRNILRDTNAAPYEIPSPPFPKHFSYQGLAKVNKYRKSKKANQNTKNK